ncbi:hypothetical protein L873DRAFT_1295937 [Choiromyces venosus 120613-1]|uniref:Uncharacterized protein n=1 Tax=Choiromyces venosus 120613-1 TaxID=1336337 RepID=A0A3N4JBQ9_9PEZI|nr:hypothetical protein L873DRAFT_1295937 [Choiromyces venosus 120613-1]
MLAATLGHGTVTPNKLSLSPSLSRSSLYSLYHGIEAQTVVQHSESYSSCSLFSLFFLFFLLFFFLPLFCCVRPSHHSTIHPHSTPHIITHMKKQRRVDYSKPHILISVQSYHTTHKSIKSSRV